MLKSTVVASIFNPHCFKRYIFDYFVAESVRQSRTVLSNFPTVEVVAFASWNLYIFIFLNNIVVIELLFRNYVCSRFLFAVSVNFRHIVVKRHSVLNTFWLTPRSVKLNAVDWHCNIFVFAIYKPSTSLIKSPALKHVVFWQIFRANDGVLSTIKRESVSAIELLRNIVSIVFSYRSIVRRIVSV